MSWREEYRIDCDAPDRRDLVEHPDCFGTSAPSPTAPESERQALLAGWIKFARDHRPMHLCPACKTRNL